MDDMRKQVQKAAEEIVLPPPPEPEAIAAAGGKINPNIKHGVIDKPDPHRNLLNSVIWNKIKDDNIHPYVKVTGCLLVCLFLPNNLANR